MSKLFILFILMITLCGCNFCINTGFDKKIENKIDSWRTKK